MRKDTWQIALLFSAGSLGAAYLNGYEWLRFFSLYGSWGTIGIVLTGAGLAWFTCSMLHRCLKNGWVSLHDLFVHLIGSKLGPSFSVVTHLVLLAYLGTSMGQQAVRYGSDRFAVLLLLVTCLSAFWLARGGINQIMKALLICGVLGVFLIGMIVTEQRHVPIPSLLYQRNGWWFISAVSYLSLHVLLCLTLLLPLVSRGLSLPALRWGLGIGSLLFFTVTMLGHFILLAYWHDINSSHQPLRDILTALLPVAAPIQAVVSLGHGCAVLAALLYGLSVPVTLRCELRLTPLLLVMMLACALFGTLSFWVGSIHLVAYTASTYCGLLLVAMYGWASFKARSA